MAVTADQVLALAQNTKALTKEQLARIGELAPTMSADELEKLNGLLTKVQESEIADMKRELEIRQKVGSAYQGWKADKSRNDLQKKEGAVKGQEVAHAESIIQNI